MGPCGALCAQIWPLLFFFLLFSCFDTLARSANFRRSGGRAFQVGKASRSSRPSAANFCNPNGSCIEQSGIEPSPSGAFQHTASRQPAHRPVTQDAGAAPHDDKRPTRFASRGLEYSLFLASEATVPGLGGGVGRAPVSPNLFVIVQAPSATPPHRCSQLRSSVGRGRSRNH